MFYPIQSDGLRGALELLVCAFIGALCVGAFAPKIAFSLSSLAFDVARLIGIPHVSQSP